MGTEGLRLQVSSFRDARFQAPPPLGVYKYWRLKVCRVWGLQVYRSSLAPSSGTARERDPMPPRKKEARNPKPLHQENSHKPHEVKVDFKQLGHRGQGDLCQAKAHGLLLLAAVGLRAYGRSRRSQAP